MSYAQRIKQIEHLHKDLDHKIDSMEKNHPGVDSFGIQEMKKLRLQYRDELARLRKLQWEWEHERVDLDDDR